MFAFFVQLFQTILAVDRLSGTVKEALAAASYVYATTATKETLSQIADAAAAQARANTKEDRHAALDRWRSALSRTRVIS